MSLSCVETFRKFVEETLGRLPFEEIERRFKAGLAENPVFAEIERSNALGKNIIIILGGRGCGKTLLLRYIKYKLESESWEFKYIIGAYLSALEQHQAEKTAQNIIAEEETKLSREARIKLAVAIDDAAELVEVAADFLKKQVELAKKYEGRFKLVLATQSERGGTLTLLKRLLSEAPFAEMFFGENPREAIIDNFKTSYIEKRVVSLFRGAALINLDAYWSRMRDLDKVEDLAEVIVKIADFYAKNAPAYCTEAVKHVSDVKHGLALIALSTLPKIAGDQEVRIIIEYGKPEDRSLNGLGIAELLARLFTDPEIRDIAEEAEKIYSVLKDAKPGITLDQVEESLLKIASEINYMTPLENLPVKSLVPIQPQPSTGASETAPRAEKKVRRYGPRVNAIEVKLRSTSGERTRYIMLVSLKSDRRGYITTSSLERIRTLVELEVPQQSEERYLAVIVPTRQDLIALYKALGPKYIKRKGIDVVPLLIDELSGLEKAFVLHTINKTFPPKFQKYAAKILAGSILLSLRDERGIPHLAYLMFPYVA
jgi:hypothetical protein